MARYRATIDTPREREDVFAYIGDFSTTQEWDPGVVEAERLNDAAVGEGTEFRLSAARTPPSSQTTGSRSKRSIRERASHTTRSWC